MQLTTEELDEAHYKVCRLVDGKKLFFWSSTSLYNEITKTRLK